jgi:hypothetical protein
VLRREVLPGLLEPPSIIASSCRSQLLGKSARARIITFYPFFPEGTYAKPPEPVFKAHCLIQHPKWTQPSFGHG